MAKWKVRVVQFVEETAVLVIDAPDLATAISDAQQMLDDGDDIDWQDGSETVGQTVSEVTDMNNKPLWNALG
jgi:hypothetical protein